MAVRQCTGGGREGAKEGGIVGAQGNECGRRTSRSATFRRSQAPATGCAGRLIFVAWRNSWKQQHNLRKCPRGFSFIESNFNFAGSDDKPDVSGGARKANRDKDGPVLKRGTPPVSSTSPTTTTSVTTPSGTSSSSDQAGKSAADNSAPDKDAPVLKRGIPPPTPKSKSDDFKVFSPKETPPAKSATKPPATPSSASTASAAANAVQLIPAISDSGGPDLRPYSYNVKPDEELAFRKKMLALAADEVRARVAQLSGAPVSSATVSSAPGKTRAAKPLSPSFDDVQLKIFDLSNINEPELVLTATARMPATAGKAGASSNLQFSDLQFMVTLVAREDVNGEFHKAMANVTDAQHLDVLPRLDLIDAVDVDGDGRGELLFRQVSDAGNAFVVYRVIGDRLYPLFQGTPGR